MVTYHALYSDVRVSRCNIQGVTIKYHMSPVTEYNFVTTSDWLRSDSGFKLIGESA